MEKKIYNGNYEVIGSGTIVGNDGAPIEFIFAGLTFIFVYEIDTLLPTTRMEKEKINDKTLRLKCINFNNSLGHGNTTPVSMGTIGNRQLFLNYRIYSLTERTGKTFHYSFLLEREATSGK